MLGYKFYVLLEKIVGFSGQGIICTISWMLIAVFYFLLSAPHLVRLNHKMIHFMWMNKYLPIL